MAFPPHVEAPNAVSPNYCPNSPQTADTMRQSGTISTSLLALALACLAGCAGPVSPQALEMLQAGYDHYGAGRHEAAIGQLDAFLADGSSKSRADEALYLRGLAKIHAKDASGAKADLSEAVWRTRNSQLRAKARIAMGDMAYDADDMALAENMYRQSLTDIQLGAKPADHARYRLGCVLQRQGRWADADAQFDRVVYFFDGTEIATLAGQRTHCVAWTIQAGVFTKKPRADAAAQSLSRDGLAAVVMPVLRKGRPVFVLQLGRSATYDQAAAALGKTADLPEGAFVAPAR